MSFPAPCFRVCALAWLCTDKVESNFSGTNETVVPPVSCLHASEFIVPAKCFLRWESNYV